MAIARSRLTAQGQISVPAVIRKRLGVSPGEVLEWEEAGGEIVVRRGGTAKLSDIHAAVFPDGPPKRKSLKALKEGIKQSVRSRHARD